MASFLSENAAKKVLTPDLSNSESFDDAEVGDNASVVSSGTGTGTGMDGNGTSTTKGDSSTSQEKMELAKKETRVVLGLRVLVFVVLILAAIAVSLIVFFITSNSEEDEYKTQYEGAAKQLMDAFLEVVETRLPAVSSLGVAIIAHAADHETQFWPFVSLSSFQERSATARKQSLALYVHVNPRVDLDQREEWESFTAINPDSIWIDEAVSYQNEVGLNFVQDVPPPRVHYDRVDPWPIWYYDSNNEVTTDKSRGPFFPTWQSSPVLYEGLETNENILANKDGFNDGANITFTTESVAISQLIMAPPGDMYSKTPSTALIALLMTIAAAGENQGEKAMTHDNAMEYIGDPVSKVYFPIYDNFEDTRKPVAILLAWIRWADYFANVLPASIKGIIIVIQDSCGGEYSYLANGVEVIGLGPGDHHDPNYSSLKRTMDFSSVQNIADGTKYGMAFNHDFCPISISIYPSDDFEETFTSQTPLIMTLSVAMVFVFTAFMFLIYDRLVERRQMLVLRKAAQTHAVVSSLFPKNVRDRLLQGDDANQSNKSAAMSGNGSLNSPAIADLFPACTVCFADIAGFTAWSSTRDPAQVFSLLETVYASFDKIAKRRKVFKVETIGDCYLAVTGLPEPQANHALIMARFANECNQTMIEVTHKLECTLGPDTAELAMRFGLHSGQVTAGVLRGARARFQLFGDTVNTAARMESLGVKSKVQISQSTYDLLVQAGKGHWAKPRADQVQAKGKGLLATYWLNSNLKGSGSSAESCNSGTSDTLDSELLISKKTMLKHERLVNWIVEILHVYLLNLVKHRKPLPGNTGNFLRDTKDASTHLTSLDEVAEVIYLPRFDKKDFEASMLDSQREVQVPEEVLLELKEYVSEVASLYNNNPFHNFEHACHVTLSTNKLLSRVVSKDVTTEMDGADIAAMASKKHDYTLGINSDPLSSLAILFSALIHDAGHRGVSNAQLIKEDKAMADKYKNKSLAEQHSLDTCWDLLMAEGQFEALRGCLFTTASEMKRFRQVMVNVVLATDIFDKELNELRKNRWSKAFDPACTLSENESTDLRATIVIEHIIQASDVCHTMQHWHVYRKWNALLFRELYLAYRQGRMGSDPCKFWYQGELGFFDNYIIPLAKKLKECQVFGVSSDEYLAYALQNRKEWEERGADIVEDLKKEVSSMVDAEDVQA